MTGEEDGKYELVATEDGLTLWAWAGTVLLIKNGDSVVFEASLRFPNVEISKVRKLWEYRLGLNDICDYLIIYKNDKAVCDQEAYQNIYQAVKIYLP